MGDLLANLVDWMASLPTFWAYAIILTIAYTENVIPPIPGDMVIVFGGYMVGIGELNMVSVIVMATIGGAAGFMTMYAIGRRVGHAFFVPKKYQWLPKSRIEKVKSLLSRWGFRLVAANRFLSGLRSVISLTVGMVHMASWRATVYATLSALVWTSLLVTAGYLVGDNWSTVSVYLRNYGWFMAVAILLFAVYHGIALRRRHLRLIAQEAESERPVSHIL